MFTAPSVTTKGAIDEAIVRSRSSRKRKLINYHDSDSNIPSSQEQPLGKRAKSLQSTSSPFSNAQDLFEKQVEEEKAHIQAEKAKAKAEAETKKNDEKRLRRYRARPPQSYLEVKERALTQRLTVLERERCGTDEEPEEKVTMAGTTGNVYTQRICKVPSCNCPHALKRNQCKHIIYVMLRVLKAPEHIGYQLALTSKELRELFRNAPPIPNADNAKDDTGSTEEENRKPIEGECPICYMDFEPSKEAITYCKDGCGNNVHEVCMQNWMAAKSGKATCPYCRALWAADEMASFKGKVDLDGAERTDEGYVNVAGQLGLSGERDYSTYHPYWVRQQHGYGGSQRRSEHRGRRQRDEWYSTM